MGTFEVAVVIISSLKNIPQEQFSLLVLFGLVCYIGFEHPYGPGDISGPGKNRQCELSHCS